MPIALGKVAVEAIREDWLVEDRWWPDRPLRRHYYELVLADGRKRHRPDFELVAPVGEGAVVDGARTGGPGRTVEAALE
jgi:hypothetical protein